MWHKRRADPGLEVELPITPMLDMAFQLLTFFVFTYHPSSFEGLMQLNLPGATETKAANTQQMQPTPSDTTLELPSDLTVVIKGSADGSGAPSEYVVEKTEGPSPPLKTLQQLEDSLVKARKDVKNADDVKIRVEGRLKYDFVMRVMDICTHPDKGGFKRVSFAWGS